MLINEVCESCGLTKKAVEYYIKQGLVCPAICENGYRDFSQADIVKLRKISILRRLELGLNAVESILNSENPSEVLQKVILERELEIERKKDKIQLLEKLAGGCSWDEIDSKIRSLTRQQTIVERLLNAFPGYYGRFICVHFGQFLDEPIETEEQKKAYDEIVKFLDNIGDLSFPPELEELLNENSKKVPPDDMKKMSAYMLNAVQNIDKFIKDNEEFLDQYITYKNSDEYKKSSAYKLQVLLHKFNQASGYYEIFIPNMKKLSPKYAQYHVKLEASKGVMISKYPGIASNEK